MDASILTRLQARQAQLAEVFLKESDPEAWRQSSGDRYWDKKSASQTLTLVCRIESLVQMHKGDKPLPDDDFDVEAAEKRALREADRIIAGLRATDLG